MKEELLFLPDTQDQHGVPKDHLRAAGNYIVEKQPDHVVHIGDHWDMPSLSQYEEKGSKYWEGKAIQADLDAGYEGMEELLGPLWNHNRKRGRWKKAPYKPNLVFTRGNHEQRLDRLIHNEPRLDGVFSHDSFQIEKFGWTDVPFLEPIIINGVAFSHYFCNPDSVMSNPVGGTIENRLSKLGHSFAQGHEQTFKSGIKYNALGAPLRGLVCGSFYQHDEEYRGAQKNRQHWRGILYMHELEDGYFSLMEVSLDYLLREYL